MWRIVFLLTLSTCFAITDYLYKKIPNLLIIVGLMGGILFNFWIDPLPTSEHIMRSIMVVVIIGVGFFRLLGMGDIKFWIVLNVLTGALASSIIVFVTAFLVVLYALIIDKKLAEIVVTTRYRISLSNKAYPFTTFMLLPVVVYSVLTLTGVI